jgi:hypothetical protein
VSGQSARGIGTLMNEPDPGQAASFEDLAACLHHLHVLADKPTSRALEKQTEHLNGLLPGTPLTRVPLRRNAISEVLQAKTFPRKAFLLTLVEALGIDLEADQRWEQAWNRLAVNEQQITWSAEEAERLRLENEELRQQLADSEQRARTAEDHATEADIALAQARAERDAAISRAHAAETQAAAARAARAAAPTQPGTSGPAARVTTTTAKRMNVGQQAAARSSGAKPAAGSPQKKPATQAKKPAGIKREAASLGIPPPPTTSSSGGALRRAARTVRHFFFIGNVPD